MMKLRSGKRKFLLQNENSALLKKDLDGDSDDASIQLDRGLWDDDEEELPWLGCVCGVVHPRPIQVFWIQCDDMLCRSWYNVREHCIGMTASQAASSQQNWFCPTCTREGWSPFLDISDELMYHILAFLVERPMDGQAIIYHQIGKLCKASYRAVVRSKAWDGLFSLMLQQEYKTSGAIAAENSNTGKQQQKQRQKQRVSVASSPARRQSQRRHVKKFRPRYYHSNTSSSLPSPREELRDVYLHSCARTDDAHMSLQTMGESRQRPLSLPRLRRLLQSHAPLRINRRSAGVGRTFLIECCAADYVDERVVLRCVMELVQTHKADPNVFATEEAPWANRPALYFAVARVMPAVVSFLVKEAGASLTVQVEGRFRLVSDPSKSIQGRFTPLEFARELRRIESEEERLPSYYIAKLGKCIRLLSEAQVDLPTPVTHPHSG